MYTVQDGVTGFLVPDRDPEALADKMGHILSEPELRDGLGRQALEATKRFVWGNIADEIVRLYEETVVARA